MSTLYRETPRKARKEHRCEEARTGKDGKPAGCVRTARITPGTRYVSVAIVWEGTAETVKLCARCARAWDRAVERYGPWDEDGGGPSFGYLVAWLEDAHRLGEETNRQRRAREEKQREAEAAFARSAEERERAQLEAAGVVACPNAGCQVGRKLRPWLDPPESSETRGDE